MKIPTGQIPQTGSVKLQPQLGRLRIIGTKFEASNSKGNPMTTLTCEVIEPEEVAVDGKLVKVAGEKATIWLIHNPEKDWGGQGMVETFCRKLNVDLDGSYDTELHKEYFKGMEFDIILSSRELIKRYPPKPGQSREEADPILDANGKVISSGWQIQANLSDVPDNCRPSRNEAVANQPF